jgi:hypothetical protein
MPLYWTLDFKARLITAAVEGAVTLGEFGEYLDVLDQAGIHRWRKLVDATQGQASMTADDIMALAVRIRGSHQRFQVGPLAIVAQQHKVEPFTRVLGVLVAANRPLRVFADPEPARIWLLGQALSARKERSARSPRP